MTTTARESGPADQPPEYLIVGEIVAPFGTKGEVKVVLDTDFPDLLLNAKTLYIGDPPICLQVESARRHQGMILLKFAGYDDRNAVESLRDLEVQVPRADVPAPAEGEYYYYQLVGLEVWTDQGELLGKVEDVQPTGSNEVLVVRGSRGELLLPVIESVVLGVDLEARRIRVHLLEGLR